MSADEQRLFRLYGKLPNKKDLLQNKLKVIHSLAMVCLNLTPNPRNANTLIQAITLSLKRAKPPIQVSLPLAPNIPRPKKFLT